MENKRRIIRQTEEVKTPPKFEPTPDGAFEIDVAGEKAGNSLIAFVEREIFRMNKKLLFDGKSSPSMYELDMALSTYEQTLFGLIALYEQAKFDAEMAKEKWTEFYNAKYMEVRNTYNTKDAQKAQWLSAKELEATVYSIYKKEVAELRANIMEMEGKRSTMQRLLSGWESYQFILGQLSRNSIASINASMSTVDLKRGDETE